MLKRVKEGNSLWVFLEKNVNIPSSFLRDPETFAKECGKVVIESKKTLVFLYNEFFIKVYKLNFLEKVKVIFGKGRPNRELKGVLRLLESNIPLPKPIAYGKKGWLLPSRYFYISELIKPAIPFAKVEPLRTIIPAVAEVVRKMHEAGIFHRDLHAGNIIVKENQIFLTDLHRHRFFPKGLPEKLRFWDIACLLYSLKEDDKRTFLTCYFQKSIPSAYFDVEKKVLLHNLKHTKKDCLKNSVKFGKFSKGNVRCWFNKFLDMPKINQILDIHNKIVAERSNELKKLSKKNAVTLFFFDGDRLCVKEFKYEWIKGIKEAFRLPKPRRAWLNANVLFALGIGRMEPLALMEEWKGIALKRAFLIIRSPGGYLELPQLLKQISDDKKEIERLEEEFAKFFLSLQKNIIPIWHKDLKAHHILVIKNDEKIEFALIEFEDILFKRVKMKNIIKNLVQINTSIPCFVSLKTRIKFLSYLFKKDQIKKIAKDIHKMSVKRGFSS